MNTRKLSLTHPLPSVTRWSILMVESNETDLGEQPLDRLMESWKLENHLLVETSTEQLTHKQVQRARAGRRLTLKMMMKVTRAFNVAIWNRLNSEQKETYFEYGWKHLFSYAKGYDANWEDPNKSLYS